MRSGLRLQWKEAIFSAHYVSFMKGALFSVPIFLFIFSLHLEWFLVRKVKMQNLIIHSIFWISAMAFATEFFQGWNSLTRPLAINFPPPPAEVYWDLRIPPISFYSALRKKTFLRELNYVAAMPHLSSNLSGDQLSSQQKWNTMQLNKAVTTL